MFSKRLLFVLFFVLVIADILRAQRIVYSEPEKDDSRRMVFEIIGKIDGNFLIYKNLKGKNWIAIYDNDMKQVSKVGQEFMPDERLVSVDFFPYTDFFYAIYQYQKKNVVHCMAAKIDGLGKKISEVVELDTTHIGFSANDKIYSVITSEDKSKFMVFKINSKNKDNFVITTNLFNDSLQLLKRSVINMPMDDRNDYLDEYYVDNDGDFVFAKFYRQNSDVISRAMLVVKYAQVDTFSMNELNIEKRLLDEVHVKIDNIHKRYFLTSFYYKERRGNIDGFYYYVWDKSSGKPEMENTVTFGKSCDEMRKAMRI